MAASPAFGVTFLEVDDYRPGSRDDEYEFFLDCLKTGEATEQEIASLCRVRSKPFYHGNPGYQPTASSSVDRHGSNSYCRDWLCYLQKEKVKYKSFQSLSESFSSFFLLSRYL